MTNQLWFIFVSAWEPGLGKSRTCTKKKKKKRTYKGLWEYRRNPAIWVSLWIYLRLYLTLERMFWIDHCWFITWEQKHTGETDTPLGSWGVLNYIQDVHCEFFFWYFKGSCQDDVNLVSSPLVENTGNVSPHAEWMLRLYVVFLVNLCFISNCSQLFTCTCHINVFFNNLWMACKSKDIYCVTAS